MSDAHGCDWCVDGVQADGETPCPCQNTRIEALTAKLSEVEAERDAREQQVMDMLEAQECACGHDNPTDVCLGHYAATQALRRIDVARAEAAEARERDAYQRGFKAALEKAAGIVGTQYKRDVRAIPLPDTKGDDI